MLIKSTSSNMADENEAYLNGDDRFYMDERFEKDISEKQQKAKKKKFENDVNIKKGKTSVESGLIVRYDPSLPEHKKYELKLGKDNKPLKRLEDKEPRKKKKKKEKLSRVEKAPEPVSTETYVKVSENLKGYFQKKDRNNDGFSILKMLDGNEVSNKDTNSEEEKPSETMNKNQPINNFISKLSINFSENKKSQVLNIERINFDKETSATYNKIEEQNFDAIKRSSYFNPKIGKIYCPETGVWYDTLFPKEGDLRLEEGIKWLNTKPEMPENWPKFRRELFFNALGKQLKSIKKQNSTKNPHQQRREQQMNKARKYIHKSIRMKQKK